MNQHFVPVAIKTSRVSGPRIPPFLRKLGCCLKVHTGKHRLHHYPLERSATALQRATQLLWQAPRAPSMLTTVPFSFLYYLLHMCTCHHSGVRIMMITFQLNNEKSPVVSSMQFHFRHLICWQKFNNGRLIPVLFIAKVSFLCPVVLLHAVTEALPNTVLQIELHNVLHALIGFSLYTFGCLQGYLVDVERRQVLHTLCGAGTALCACSGGNIYCQCVQLCTCTLYGLTMSSAQCLALTIEEDNCPAKIT